jgi:hypothetical protein
VGIALFSPSNLFYTDGSLMDGVAGFAFQLAAIHMAMDHIENEALGRYLILTDSISSLRAMES